MSVTRRTFFKTSALAAAGLSIPDFSPASGLLAAPGDPISVALIGCRNMGWGDLRDMMAHKEVTCLALCDVDRSILDSRGNDLLKLQERKADLYDDYRRILDRKDINAVIIGTPDHWHCLPFTDACSAGKEIYVEKPIANSIAECDAMVAAAAKYGTVVQVGQQQRSSGHWQEMVKYLRSGALGKIGHVHVWANFNYAAMAAPVPDSVVPDGVDFDRWLGPAPLRSFNRQRFHGSWRMFWDYGGGLMTDWGVHLLDMGLWGMDVKGMPLKIQASGGKFLKPEGAHETYDTQSVTWQYEEFMMTWEHNAGTETGPYGRNYGVLFRGTNGTLVANRENWEVIPEKDKAEAVKVAADHLDHKNHLTNFVECIKTRNRNTACTIENGSLCAKYAHLGNIAARMGGTTLVYDDHLKRFDNRVADAYLRPAYRAPWKFPEV